jgi:hypothetical protein
MPLQQFTDDEVQTKAEQLGLVQPGQPVPTAVYSKVKAAIVEDRRADAHREAPAAQPQMAESIVVQPGGAILVDGKPFPWLVASEDMAITLSPEPNGISSVRLTLLADSVQILPPKTDSTESE